MTDNSTSKVFILENNQGHFTKMKDYILNPTNYKDVEVVPNIERLEVFSEEGIGFVSDWHYIIGEIEKLYLSKKDLSNFLQSIYEKFKDSYIFIIDRHLIADEFDDIGLSFLSMIDKKESSIIVSQEVKHVENLRKDGVKKVTKYQRFENTLIDLRNQINHIIDNE